MNRRTLETTVGVFVLIGLLCVGYLTLSLGQLEILGRDVYELEARFHSAAGLKIGASVEIAGVSVGRVEKIFLDPETQYAVVIVSVNNGIELTDDVIASVKTAGLIGDKYISLSPGGSDIILKQGDRITETEPAVNLEEIISKYVHGGV